MAVYYVNLFPKNINVLRNSICFMCSKSTSTVCLEPLRHDMIGPPHPVSNLRPIVRLKAEDETDLQRKLRTLQDETQEWNQKFWEQHNASFVEQRQAYVKRHVGNSDRTLNADEMSGFYKNFLDSNWQRHYKYNFQWYGKNFQILILSLQVSAEAAVKRFF